MRRSHKHAVAPLPTTQCAVATRMVSKKICSEAGWSSPEAKLEEEFDVSVISFPNSCWQRNARNMPGCTRIGRKDDDRECSTGKILLVAQLLIRRHKHIELCLGSPEQFAVLCDSPPHILNRANLEMTQPCLNDMENRFVEKNLQADLASVNSVDFENLRTWIACWRVTVRKFSRNLPRERPASRLVSSASTERVPP